MQYMFLIYSAEGSGPQPGSPEFDALMAGYGAFTSEVKEAGKMKEGAPLQGVDTATTVRMRGGKPEVTDGPFEDFAQSAVYGGFTRRGPRAFGVGAVRKQRQHAFPSQFDQTACIGALAVRGGRVELEVSAMHDAADRRLERDQPRLRDGVCHGDGLDPERADAQDFGRRRQATKIRCRSCFALCETPAQKLDRVASSPDRYIVTREQLCEPVEHQCLVPRP